VREVTEMVSCISTQVTVSKQGGVVNEPLYVQYFVLSSVQHHNNSIGQAFNISDPVADQVIRTNYFTK